MRKLSADDAIPLFEIRVSEHDYLFKTQLLHAHPTGVTPHSFNTNLHLQDPLLPKDFNIVKPNDYTESGFSRGHMTRSGDRTANTTDNCATFFLTNIVPQTQEQNEGSWLELENLSRELAQSGKELYIVAGPLGEGGTGLKGAMTRIKDKITVSESTWKIVLVLDKPGLGVKGVTTKTRVIAVRMPNTLGIQADSYKKYLTTVDELEKLTGYDFLSDLPVGVQAVIEAKKDS